MAGLSRPYPTGGLGYSFRNEGLADFSAQTGVLTGEALSPSALGRAFTDWGRNVVAARQASSTTSDLASVAAGGLCYGMALSAGRFDALVDPVASAPAGRSGAAWARAGSGPGAASRLPVPSPPLYGAGADSTYNREMLSLLAVDWTTQFSREVSATLQRQHYAYSDRTAGVDSMKSQLSSVMLGGVDRYDPSGTLGGPPNSGLAVIVIQTFGAHPAGHAVLAYSAEPRSGGGLSIDVWDNNIPGEQRTFDIDRSGSWTYDGADVDRWAQGQWSMSASGGHPKGYLSVLPLYTPFDLHFFPEHVGGVGSGTYVDVPPGSTVQRAVDAAGAEADIEPVATGVADGDGGAIIDLPSDGGQVTLSGARPSLGVRGADTSMTADATGTTASQELTATTDQQAGAISTTGVSATLSVARHDRVLHAQGASGLTFAPDGSVSASGLAGRTSLTIDFDDSGTTRTATLYASEAPTSGSISFTAEQVAEAQQATSTPPGGPSASTTEVPPPAASSTAARPSVPAASPAVPPALRLAVAARPTRLRAFLRAGLVVRAACSASCDVRLALSVPAASARRAGLVTHGRPVTLARANGEQPAGARKYALRLKPSLVKRLRAVKGLSLRLAVTATSGAAGRASATKVVRIRR